MTTRELFLESWEWRPSIVLGCVALIVAYLAAVRPLRPWRLGMYVVGVLALLLTLVGPLDVLGDAFLFSAHMLEHLVFLVVVPPLLLMGLPRASVASLLRWPPAAHVERVVRRPVVAWSAMVVSLYAWHAPPLYNAALAHEGIHIAQHLTFLVTATVFWWPVLTPVPEHRLGGHVAIVYLFLAALANSVLGAVLTFSGPGLYPWYVRPTGGSPELALIRRGWGLTPAADQQFGGLFMWVVGALFFLWAVLAAYARWYRESGTRDVP